MDQPTVVLNQTIALTPNPDAIALDEVDGHQILDLGNRIQVALGLSSQDALDKLATLTAKAAADNRARHLREVA
ncbi:hypothetical protein OIE75_29325 [Streptomyces sp. NBC_01723]|uniref:hypothetical protein n=1 Tax=Streptomyces sp. NBC_01723 TaxID=2975921 RepID=UPI002E30D6A0|nr:hypothetical protein [Streptomyces sp. NBC_01723]